MSNALAYPQLIVQSLSCLLPQPNLGHRYSLWGKPCMSTVIFQAHDDMNTSWEKQRPHLWSVTLPSDVPATCLPQILGYSTFPTWWCVAIILTVEITVNRYLWEPALSDDSFSVIIIWKVWATCPSLKFRASKLARQQNITKKIAYIHMLLIDKKNFYKW